jgi:uncharacterized protein YfdQ (DUF2303 family)
MVPLPVQEIEFVPSPKYSTIAPVPPFTVSIPDNFKITSFENLFQSSSRQGMHNFQVQPGE